MKFSEKMWKNSSHQKGEENIWCQKQSIIIKKFSQKIYQQQNGKNEMLMNKPVYLGLSILELSKMLMYESWYDYVKPKYDEETKLCYMDTHSFIVYRKTGDIYKDIVEDVETRPLPKEKYKKLIGLMKGQVSGKIMTKHFGLRVNTYRYLIDNVSEDKKAKFTLNCVIKRELKFKNYKNCF